MTKPIFVGKKAPIFGHVNTSGQSAGKDNHKG
jgi:hypothetical protein